MAEIVNLFRCLVCGYEMETRLNQRYRCPACQHEWMSYITSRPRK